MTRRALAAVLAATSVLLTSAVLTAVPAHASVAAPLGPDIVLSLRAGPTASETITALAAAHNVTSATRRAALAAVAPPASATAAVTVWASELGLSVTPISAWSVEVSGPANVEAAQFGDGSVVPAAIAEVVSAALPPGRSKMVPHVTDGGTSYAPTDFASAYDEPLMADSGAGITVATVQFQAWTQGDAARWAAAQQPAITLAEGQIQTVPVTSTLAGDGTDNGETPLDVEAILAAAPAANQLVYEANDDSTSPAAMYDRLASDAGKGDFQVLSSSWGLCEPLTARGDLTDIEADLKRIIAAGVTVVAASGDSGAYDCDTPADASDGIPADYNNGLAVDFPASSPYVVAVGGTTLTGSASKSWAESTWSSDHTGAKTTDTKGYAGDGSGGGVSSIFTMPSWQTTATGGTSQSYRQLPDISLDADPGTGFDVYSTPTPPADGSASDSPWVEEGGTSLAAPLFAGQLASLLSTATCTATCGGFGDIHSALYAAATATSSLPAFRDVTKGGNFYYQARTGYDEATGLGSPQLAALANALPPRGAAPTPPAAVPPMVAAPDPCPCADPVLVAPSLSNHNDLPISVLGGAGDSFAVVAANVSTCTTGAFSSVAPTSVHLPGDGANVVTLLSLDPDNGCHVSRATVTLDTTPPSARVSGGLLSPLGVGSVVRLAASEPVTQLVTVQRLDTRSVTVFGPVDTSAAAISLTLPAGVYRVSAIPTDVAGNVGSAVTSTWTVPLDSGLRQSRGWSVTSRVSGAYAGTLLTTGRVGSTLTGKGYGRSVLVRYRCQPGGGALRALVDGRVRLTVGTSCARTSFRTMLVRGLSARDHTVVLALIAGRRLSVDDVAFGV